MSAVTDFPGYPSEPELAPYRAISRSAIVSVVLAAVSLPLVGLALFAAASRYGDAVMLGLVGSIFAAAAAVLGLAALWTIRRYPTEYTGTRLARTGLFGGVLLFVSALPASVYTYATEVPDGYTRVWFDELKRLDEDHPELPVSPRSLELSGQKIFIKGYMHPSVASTGSVKHFILVSDFGTCCFGGQPKPTHMIEVHFPDNVEGVRYSTRTLKLAGTFFLADRPIQSMGLNGVWYHMQVEQVR
jgi:Protein of unknown function (DUF3299)